MHENETFRHSSQSHSSRDLFIDIYHCTFRANISEWPFFTRKFSFYPPEFLMTFFQSFTTKIAIYYSQLCEINLVLHQTSILSNMSRFYFIMIFITAKTVFHHCTVSFITARFVHHCTLKQALHSRMHLSIASIVHIGLLSNLSLRRNNFGRWKRRRMEEIREGERCWRWKKERES